MKPWKKALKITLVVVLILALVGGTAWLGTGIAVSQMGDHVYCVLNRHTGTAVVFGHGEMWSVDQQHLYIGPASENLPLPIENAPYVRKLIILNGIRNISPMTFCYCVYLEEVYIPLTVTEIDSASFPWDAFVVPTFYFGGDAPQTDWDNGSWTLFNGQYNEPCTPTVYHKPGTTGWDAPEWTKCNVVEKNFVNPLVLPAGAVVVLLLAGVVALVVATKRRPKTAEQSSKPKGEILMKQRKKLPKIALIVVLILALVGGTAWLGTGIAVSQMGDHVYCVLNRHTGTAVVFGHGEMWPVSQQPGKYMISGTRYVLSFPNENAKYIRKLIIQNGIHNIPPQVFCHCSYLEKVYIPLTVTQIDRESFCREPSVVPTFYFGGNAPQTGLGHGSWELSTGYGPCTPTVYHKPGTFGWDSSLWRYYNVVEKDFASPFLPLYLAGGAVVVLILTGVVVLVVAAKRRKPAST